jgi:hypothetical protein
MGSENKIDLKKNISFEFIKIQIFNQEITFYITKRKRCVYLSEKEWNESFTQKRNGGNILY